MPLHLGILQTDSVLEDLQPRFGDYPSMFEGLFRAEDPTMSFTTYNVQDALPDNLDCQPRPAPTRCGRETRQQSR